MTRHPAFRYVAHWQTDLPDEGEAVLAFWRDEDAIGDENQARQRLKEIVLHARDESDEIAGVCTAVPITLPRLAQPMYYYRCFIGKKWRTSRLVLLLVKRAFELLEGYARKNGYPCIGMVIELENARFAEAGRDPVWPDIDFVYIGKSQRGHDLRVRYFRGAKLKSASKA
jgi:hypothetical protein